MTGAYGKFFRTGGGKSATEVLHEDLNEALGSAYSPEPGTNVHLENYADARSLAEIYDAIVRLKNQALAKKMTVSIPEWEETLGIIPRAGASDGERRDAILAKFRMFNVSPTFQSVKDYLRFLLGDLFVDIIRTPPEATIGAVPGGAVIPGGATLQDAPPQSFSQYLALRFQQPLGMPDSEYIQKAASYRKALEDFLPADVLFAHGRYGYQPPGTISVAQGSNIVTGSGTSFAADPAGVKLSPGDDLETYDDRNQYVRLYIASVDSATQITLQTPAASNITSKRFKIAGFVTGFPNVGATFLKTNKP